VVQAFLSLAGTACESDEAVAWVDRIGEATRRLA
jgi:hypothetical protein